MQINFATTLRILDGKPLADGSLTLGAAAANGLLEPSDPNTKLEGIEIVRRYSLAQRIFESRGRSRYPRKKSPSSGNVSPRPTSIP